MSLASGNGTRILLWDCGEVALKLHEDETGGDLQKICAKSKLRNRAYHGLLYLCSRIHRKATEAHPNMQFLFPDSGTGQIRPKQQKQTSKIMRQLSGSGQWKQNKRGNHIRQSLTATPDGNEFEL